MRSATPKVLHRMAGRTLVEHAVRAVAALDPARLVVVTGHGKQAVEEHLGQVAAMIDRRVDVAVQERQLGTGHAVSCAQERLSEQRTGTVLVTYGDVPLLGAETIGALLDEHRGRGNAVTVLSAVVDDPRGYGRVVRAADGTVTEIVEHKDATDEQLRIGEINAGVYAFDAQLLHTGLRRLSTANAQGELYLPDLLGIARADGHGVGALVCTDPWQVEGVNNRVQLATLGAEYNRRLVREAMFGGATMLDPATVWLDAGVRVGQDVVIEPNVQLRGATEVCDGARVGPDTTLDSVQVGAGAEVVRTHGSDAVVGPGAEVGPFAYLRPGTRLGGAAKIGTFVEVKNSQIGDDSKVPHLSYLGDATVGECSNIGAASVVVNYDGVHKHETVIGSHVRMGCDNMYVAPVHVGDGAYSGAGAVIREDVPSGALAVSAGAQRNIEGWVVRKRPGTAAAEAAKHAPVHGEAESADQEDQGS